MTELEYHIGLSVLIFVVIFVVSLIMNLRKYSKKNKKKNKEIMEIVYLTTKFKLDKNKLPIKKLIVLIAFLNAFIITVVALTVILCNTYLIVQLLIGFILLLALIYAIYEILGRYLVKKGYEKNGK